MLRRIINKLRNLRENGGQLSRYVKNGNVIIGKNCKIQHLNIYITDPADGIAYISIGDDCMISGNILIYGKEARVEIGNGVFIGNGTTLFCRNEIKLENDIMISWGCTLIDTNAHSLHSMERISDVRDWIKGERYKNWEVVESSPLYVEESCWIGFNSIITKGVVLKRGSVIGCGSVVTKSTEAYGVYGGNPAVFIKKTD